LVSTVIKYWDKENWLSSKTYISSFNKFILMNSKLNSNSEILDIGCGRGKIAGSLSSKLKLKFKPIGIDLVNHRDKDKRIFFKKIDALSFFLTNKKKFDLILIKQTIHLLQLNDIKKLLIQIKKSLKPKGRVFILTLNPRKNELPTFFLMRRKLLKSLKRDKKILSFISKLYPNRILKIFNYKVKIDRQKYAHMISKRFISTLLNLSNKQILSGINEIILKYKKKLRFNDKLVCIIIKNN
jgi:ubiquinone/menaquinone biosynthesis C-methylase UbiE|tara:strand:- start:1793 stop:2512 length:720 start_codon:yes stop_codon:yes gene_type:complete